MVALLRHETTPYSIAIWTDLTKDLPDAIVDRVQLQQVLMNLMLNAIDAMKDTGGEVTIVSRNEQDGSILVSVRDTGVGLPTENASQIFDARYHETPRDGHGPCHQPFDRDRPWRAVMGDE